VRANPWFGHEEEDEAIVCTRSSTCYYAPNEEGEYGLHAARLSQHGFGSSSRRAPASGASLEPGNPGRRGEVEVIA
jgi:hypothetical protein